MELNLGVSGNNDSSTRFVLADVERYVASLEARIEITSPET